MASGALGLLALVVSWFMGAPLYAAVVLALAAALAVPRWVLSFLRVRRENKFLEELPNAVDVIVRGVKAGLPIGVQVIGKAFDEAAVLRTAKAYEAATGWRKRKPELLA